ncbi:phosphate ABC transporter substrate-binding protein [Pseudoalteromonas xiamenensis]|uniref:phosphate ABC transporter substrate-binding protein n=1 Tax=Pseudoalteromonas xiamenensis TaxID=882626 RepID=UPI0035E7C1B7
MKRLLFAATILFSATTIAEVAIIVHPSNSNTFSESDLKNLYLGKKKTFPDGSEAIPLNLEEGGDGRTYFNQTALEKSDAQLKAYWSKLVFTGKGTPPKEVTQDEMVKLVSSNPSTIGYVDASAVSDAVKVIKKY